MSLCHQVAPLRRQWEVGDKVEAKFSGEWYPAEIVSENQGGGRYWVVFIEDKLRKLTNHIRPIQDDLAFLTQMVANMPLQSAIDVPQPPGPKTPDPVAEAQVSDALEPDKDILFLTISDEASNEKEGSITKIQKFTDIRFVLDDEFPSSSNQGSIRMKNSVDQKTQKRYRRKPKPVTLKGAKDIQLNVDQSLKMLEDNKFNWYAADLYICPPSNADCSDEDDGDEEDVSKQTPDNLSRSQLLADCEMQLDCFEESETLIISNENELSESKPAAKKVCTNQWISCQEKDKMLKLKEDCKPSKKKIKDDPSKAKGKQKAGKCKRKGGKDAPSVELATEDPDKNGNSQECFENWVPGDDQNEIIDFIPIANEIFLNDEHRNKLWTPKMLFELFFDEDILKQLCYFTNKYAMGKNEVNWKDLTPGELCCFIAILLLSGYHNLPSKRMYWEESTDVRVELVAGAMTRKRFEDILRSIHFCDNDNLDNSDKCSKIRPLITMLQERYKKFAPLNGDLDVDESMIPYYGKFGNALKQRMPKKPIRVGYKVWSLNYSQGYLHTFDVYRGKNSSNKYAKDFGLGPSVVLELCDELPGGKFRIYHDNFFTSIPLLKEMKERGFGSTGTIRRNMMGDCPVTDKSTMKGTPRASLEHFFEKESNIVVCQWNDNSPVVVGSNCIGVDPIDFAKRWNGSLKEFVDVERPHLITKYNQHMGGTDLMDQSLSNYRPRIRNRKWYWPIWLFLLQTSCFNAWRLESSLDSCESGSFLLFLRSIVRHYLAAFKQEKLINRRSTHLHLTPLWQDELKGV